MNYGRLCIICCLFFGCTGVAWPPSVILTEVDDGSTNIRSTENYGHLLMSLQLPDAYCGILGAPYIGVWLPDFLSLTYDLFIEDYYALLVISMLVQTNITAYARPGTSTQAHCVISNLRMSNESVWRCLIHLVFFPFLCCDVLLLLALPFSVCLCMLGS